MTQKNVLKTVLLVICMAFAAPFNSIAAGASTTMPADSAADARIAAHIIQRVTEIQNMDHSTLTSAEKRDLKKELRDMKKQAGALNQKVYLSIGAIIIIILLLILLL